MKRSLKAATNFVDTVEDGLTRISSNPVIHRNEYKNYFELNLQKYPFTIIYTVEESLQLVVIVAIYHQKREPLNKYR